MKKATLEEVSAGGVVYRTVPEISNQKFSNSQIKYEFLIGKHSGYHKWVLPKGLVERGESYTETAEREVEEEVGVVARVVGGLPIKTIEYWYYADLESKMGKAATGGESERRIKRYQEDPDFAKATTGEGGLKTRIHKKVVFYLMEFESDLGKAGWEMSEREWVDYEEAIARLAFESEKEVLQEAKVVLD